MPIKRPQDTVRIDAFDRDQNGGSFDAFTSLEITNDLTAPATASFECGDDGTWRTMEKLLKPGSEYRVYINGRMRLTGRVEANDVPIDAQGGATVRWDVRSKLADAAYASAKPFAVQNTSLKEVVLRAYAPLGFHESDFLFKADLARDLMTGRSSHGEKAVDLEPMQLQEAKVKPPETVYAFVERHLLRFHLSHWDSPDGKIIVGKPNDTQGPIYFFNCKRGPAGRENNVLSARRILDVADAASSVTVSGMQWNDDFTSTRIGRTAPGDPLLERFYRPVTILDQAIHAGDQAFARALREMAARNRRLEAWEVSVDGWSFWNGRESIPYGVNTVADVDIDVAGGATGAYLLHRVVLRMTPDDGMTTHLTLLRRGLWTL